MFFIRCQNRLLRLGVLCKINGIAILPVITCKRTLLLMICTDFIRFPVFNVADIFITCGCILLLVHLVFFNKAFWKDEKK